MCYVDTGIKIGNIYKGYAEDVEMKFDTSKYKLDKPLPKWKNEKSYWINER